jgi:hypothetical protein
LPLRYIYAVTASCLLVIAGFVISKYLHRSFVEEFRQNLRAAAAAGKLPKELEGVDLDTVTPAGFEIRVTDAQMARLQIADLLSYRWYIWIPGVCAVCFGIAYFLSRSASR